MCEQPPKTFNPDTVVHLILNISVLPDGWQFVWKQLNYLSLGSLVNLWSNEFAHLLNNMPNLQELTIQMSTLERITDSWKNKAVCQQLGLKVLSLIVQSDHFSTPRYRPYVRVREVRSLIRVFRRKCEHLTFNLKSHSIISNAILKSINSREFSRSFL